MGMHGWHLFLLLVPNIQRYEAEWGVYPAKRTIRAVSAAAMRSLGVDFQPMPLQALQEVNIFHGDCHCSILAREFFPLFLLPSMKKFLGGAIYEQEEGTWQYDKEESPPPKPEPGSSGITKLVLLTPLAIMGWPSTSPRAQISNVIYEALLTQRHSLQKLRLENDGDVDVYEPSERGESDDDEWDDPDEMWFGSLVESEQLREVCMPLRTLLDYRWRDHPTLSLDEVLPGSLERLILGDIYGNTSEQFPELSRINYVEFRITTVKTQTNETVVYDSVREMCEAEGVELSFNNWSWMDRHTGIIRDNRNGCDVEIHSP
ncbi:uncharacterized protein N7459_004241 [Penicillium hispanicum]|uniref:uncharacterized protein n=1 Tax=Penicillium hispanicum TaxID=1080232 RepID=UPI0025421CD2|nr:uncharacterized protein N7459_004241 [Penicillium hispanicum]KAJ5584441.1 hypothetical protein N7459_004241 [Penicillium hispanicum]